MIREMTINEICNVLKKELYNNGYEYGFYLDGKKYKPNFNEGFDKAFDELLHTIHSSISASYHARKNQHLHG